MLHTESLASQTKMKDLAIIYKCVCVYTHIWIRGKNKKNSCLENQIKRSLERDLFFFFGYNLGNYEVYKNHVESV